MRETDNDLRVLTEIGKGHHFWEYGLRGLAAVDVGEPLAGKCTSAADVGSDTDGRRQIAVLLGKKWGLVEGEKVRLSVGFRRMLSSGNGHISNELLTPRRREYWWDGKDGMPVWEVSRRDESDWALVASTDSLMVAEWYVGEPVREVGGKAIWLRDTMLGHILYRSRAKPWKYASVRRWTTDREQQRLHGERIERGDFTLWRKGERA